MQVNRLIVMLVFALSLTACGGGNTSTTPPQPSPPIPTPPVDPTPPNPAPPVTPPPEPQPSGQLEIGNTVAYGDEQFSYIVGTVTNNLNRNARFVKIVASLYDNDQTFIGSDFTYTDLDIILPGETSPFKIYVTDYADFQEYDLQLQGQATGEQPYRLEVNNLRLADDFLPKLTGQVTNTENQTLEFVKIVFTCYKNGDLVDTDFTYADLDTLAPNATSPFTDYLSSPYKAPDRCEATAQGQSY